MKTVLKVLEIPTANLLWVHVVVVTEITETTMSYVYYLLQVHVHLHSMTIYFMSFLYFFYIKEKIQKFP